MSTDDRVAAEQQRLERPGWQFLRCCSFCKVEEATAVTHLKSSRTVILAALVNTFDSRAGRYRRRSMLPHPRTDTAATLVCRQRRAFGPGSSSRRHNRFLATSDEGLCLSAPRSGLQSAFVPGCASCRFRCHVSLAPRRSRRPISVLMRRIGFLPSLPYRIAMLPPPGSGSRHSQVYSDVSAL